MHVRADLGRQRDRSLETECNLGQQIIQALAHVTQQQTSLYNDKVCCKRTTLLSSNARTPHNSKRRCATTECVGSPQHDVSNEQHYSQATHARHTTANVVVQRQSVLAHLGMRPE
jgi:hypothetical protein